MRDHGGFALGHAGLPRIADDAIAHQYDVGLAPVLLRLGAVLVGVILDHRQRLDRIGDPAVAHAAGAFEPGRHPAGEPDGRPAVLVGAPA